MSIRGLLERSSGLLQIHADSEESYRTNGFDATADDPGGTTTGVEKGGKNTSRRRERGRRTGARGRQQKHERKALRGFRDGGKADDERSSEQRRRQQQRFSRREGSVRVDEAATSHRLPSLLAPIRQIDVKEDEEMFTNVFMVSEALETDW